jgi:hypothetical protein
MTILISEPSGVIVCPDVWKEIAMPRIQATGGAESMQAMKNIERYGKALETVPGAFSRVLGLF